MTPEERFWDLVDRREDGCWIFTSKSDVKGGYKRFFVEGRFWMAHRWSYEHLVGAIPDGLTLDHLCRTPACVNPDHLEPVTHRENNLRSNAAPAVNARRTECRKGHPLAGSNLYVTPDGRRQCRECRREAGRRHHKKKAS